jgi:hypothetical protein
MKGEISAISNLPQRLTHFGKLDTSSIVYRLTTAIGSFVLANRSSRA